MSKKGRCLVHIVHSYTGFLLSLAHNPSEENIHGMGNASFAPKEPQNDVDVTQEMTVEYKAEWLLFWGRTVANIPHRRNLHWGGKWQ